MKSNSKRKKMKKRVVIAAALFAVSMGFAVHNGYASEAASQKTAVLRLIATGDIHGKVTCMDYEVEKYEAASGFSKVATLIRQARSEAGAANTLLVDAGDFLYDYSSDYLAANYPDEIQPILKAFSLLKYDFITLGNHEFDFSWTYLIKQLNQSGMTDKVVVSNLKWDDDDSCVFEPGQLITKTVLTTAGKKVKITIGVVGATREVLSSKGQRYGGYIIGEDVYENVAAEAKELKAQGADLVIAVVHGGIGVLSGSDTTVQAGARLAALDDIDAVVTAHTHEMFPLNDGTYKYYSNVDEANGLVNGKPVVGTGSYAQAIGLIDFTLSITDSGVSIEDTDVALREVKESTAEDAEVTAMFEPYAKQLTDGADTTEYELSEDTVLTNMDCVVEDTSLYQLINNAKLQYATSYIHEYLPKYADYPVIAVTENSLDSGEDYITLSGSIDEKDVAAVLSESAEARDSGYLYMYTITGKKLKEWLEFSASVYAKQGTTFSTLLKKFTARRPQVSTLLNESYVDDWSMLYLFDGISYQIDLSKDARYTAKGSVISTSNSRITNLTYQGKTVTDSQVFVIVMDALSESYAFMPAAADSIYETFPYDTGKGIVMDYIKDIAKYGPISVAPDNNWSLKVSAGYDFVLGTSTDSGALIKAKGWYYKYIQQQKGLKYYWCKYVAPKEGINLVLSGGLTAPTCQDVPVVVTVTGLQSKATIKRLMYVPVYVDDIYDPAWATANTVTDGIITVSENTTLSVLVMDSLGNVDLEHFTVYNIDESILDTPVLDLFSNRKTAVTGSAVPLSTVYAETPEGDVYTSTVSASGDFSVTIPAQRFGVDVNVWIEMDGKTSDVALAYARKVGPNAPELLDQPSAGETVLHCQVDGTETVYVLRGTKVYVGKGEASIYKASEWYDSTCTIVETTIRYDDDGSIYITVPKMAAGQKYYLYSVDWQNRSSRRTTATVQ